jgi:hypothetical protein
MRAIQVTPGNLKEIERVSGRRIARYAREKCRLLSGLSSEHKLWFIPEYCYPETKHLTRLWWVSTEYLEHMTVYVGHDGPWMLVIPRSLNEFRSTDDNTPYRNLRNVRQERREAHHPRHGHDLARPEWHDVLPA